MDYESRKVKWYWMFLYLVWCLVVIFFLFNANPYLYSRAELRGKLETLGTSPVDSVKRATIPTSPDMSAGLTPITWHPHYNAQNTATDPLGAPRGKGYEEIEKYPLDLGGLEVEKVAQDASGLYLSGRSETVIALGLDGQVRWKYVFKEEVGDASPTVLLDQTTAYLIHPKGEIVALGKKDGQIRWLMNLKKEVTSDPILLEGNILIPCKPANGATGTEINEVSRLSGKLVSGIARVEIKPGFLITDAPELERLIVTIDNKILALDPEDWSIQWTQVLTDPVKGPAVVIGTQIYAATLGAKVVKLDGTKKGKLDWEADIIKPAAGALAYVPPSGRLVVLDNSGALSAVDIKTGKVPWRVGTENKNTLHDVWAARLSSKYIEENHMDWLHKGWTAWTACSENRFCIYTPNKGLLINRIQLSGTPITLPLALDKRWVFLLQTKSGYELAHLVEDAEVKRLRKEKTE